MTDRPSHAHTSPPPHRDDAFSETIPSDPAPSESLTPPPTSRSLWDIAHPLEVAYSILIHHADPMQELRRRVRYARKRDNPEENLRFWGEVAAYLKAARHYSWDVS
tara:strand:+ start:4695 stop:5012 length:318 start_codon:yes stop_codon:yes gene_type:complete